MTRKDYETIARALRMVRRDLDDIESMHPSDVIDGVASELAHVLASDNAQFDRERFISACHI